MANTNITINDMLNLSNELYEKHKHEWTKATPESNIMWLCWLIGEVGEVIDIVKKKGADKIMNDQSTRKEMIEELTDCYMYLTDIINRYQFTAEEFSRTYFDKMNYNLKRDYNKGKTSTDKKK